MVTSRQPINDFCANRRVWHKVAWAIPRKYWTTWFRAGNRQTYPGQHQRVRFFI